MEYRFVWVNGHVEVYDQMGRFCFSADNKREAMEELEEAAGRERRSVGFRGLRSAAFRRSKPGAAAFLHGRRQQIYFPNGLLYNEGKG